MKCLRSFAFIGLVAISQFAVANDKIDITPAKPVDCKVKPNSLVSTVLDATISKEEGNIKISVLWNHGKCHDVIKGNGKAAKYINFAKLGLKSSNGGAPVLIDDLKITSKQTVQGKYVVTDISFPESTLDLSNEFSLYLVEGIFLGVSKWKLEITNEDQENLSLKIKHE